MTGIFQNIEDRNPVFAGGFHTDLGTVVRKKPFFQNFEVRIEGGRPFLFISGHTGIVSRGNGSDHKFFVNVDATADKVLNREHKTNLLNIYKQTLTGSPAKKDLRNCFDND